MREEARREDTPPEGTDREAAELPLTGHLSELRKRLINSVVTVLVAFLITYSYSEEVYSILARPLMPALPEGTNFLAFSGVVEPFYTYLKAAIVAAIVLSSPVIIYQFWAFVAPGLYKDEKRWFVPIVTVSLGLFGGGVLFAYNIVFPVGFDYLLGFASSTLKPVLSMGDYFSLATKMLIAFGIVFQIPLLILVLARLGLVDAKSLIGYWRYALLTSVIAGALLTPPDIFSQLLMGGPIMILYAMGIVLASLFGKKGEADKGTGSREAAEGGDKKGEGEKGTNEPRRPRDQDLD